jgi:Asp-tRNA(Asn)/Glu-tRNA(Gln) amidotransferase A subunit family amidase
MTTTAGSLALEGSDRAKDSVRRGASPRAGAVILGKNRT